MGIDGAQVLLEPLDQQPPPPLVLRSHQIVLAEVLVAGTLRMALVEAEHLVDGSLRPELVGHHLTRARRHRLAVGRILQLAVPLVAGALPRILAAIEAVAEALSASLLQVLPDVVVDDDVRLDVLRHKEFELL